jgi:hypothetical protein
MRRVRDNVLSQRRKGAKAPSLRCAFAPLRLCADLGRVPLGAICALALCAAAAAAGGTPPAVVRVVAGGERIPTLRAARGLTTMLVLPEEAREAICGDLYDPQTGNGGFVIQRSGRDLFLKPLRAAGSTNLFVKTERATYAFELVVVAAPRAMRIVRVEPAPDAPAEARERDRLAADRAALEADRAALARERAAATEELARRRAELDADVAARAAAAARAWLVEGVRGGATTIPVARRSARSARVEVELGGVALAVAGRVYLRCAVRNRGRAPVTLAAVEVGAHRVDLAEALPPGASTTLVVEIPTRPDRDATLRLLDPAGTPLVALRPFR